MKTPTAEEFLKSKNYHHSEDYYSLLVKFAKIHVEAALKKASESKSTYVKYDLEGNKTHPTGLNKQSILNAYPLDNIK